MKGRKARLWLAFAVLLGALIWNRFGHPELSQLRRLLCGEPDGKAAAAFSALADGHAAKAVEVFSAEMCHE